VEVGEVEVVGVVVDIDEVEEFGKVEVIAVL
jgi:hypothetical protein